MIKQFIFGLVFFAVFLSFNQYRQQRRQSDLDLSIFNVGQCITNMRYPWIYLVRGTTTKTYIISAFVPYSRQWAPCRASWDAKFYRTNFVTMTCPINPTKVSFCNIKGAAK